MEAEANNFEKHGNDGGAGIRRLQEVGQDKGPRFDGAVLDIASRAKLSKFRGPIEETAAAKDHKWCHPQFR